MTVKMHDFYAAITLNYCVVNIVKSFLSIIGELLLKVILKVDKCCWNTKFQMECIVVDIFKSIYVPAICVR